MILVFQAICLIFTVCVLNSFIASGIASKMHRLLPLFLGMVVLYNFFQVLECFLGEARLFIVFEDLILLQIMYIVCHYLMDFFQITFKVWAEVIFMGQLIVMDVIASIHFMYPDIYTRFYYPYCFICLLALLGFGTFVYSRYSHSKREHRVANLLYISLLIPGITLQFRNAKLITGEILIPMSLLGTCGIILYLIMTDQLSDTTALIQENLFSTSEVAILLFDMDYYFLEANDAARELFQENFKNDKKDKKNSLYVEEIKNIVNNPPQNTEVKIGDEYYSYQLEKVYHHGKQKGYVLSYGNITKQKQEVWNMEQLKQEAETQTVMKSQFLANMSHDLKSPLHAITGIGEVLSARKDLSAKNRFYVTQIQNASEVLLGLVNDILSFSKLEAGKLVLAQEVYSFEDMIRELAQMCMVNIQNRPIEFYIDFVTECPKKMVGDQMRVREIIQNLFSNATKFTEQGEIICEINCSADEDEEYVTIECCVKDTGCGMSKEELEQIFEQYTSFADLRSKEGAGLGLNIAMKLAQMMDGAITATSDGVSGSEVKVTFVQKIAGGQKIMPQRITKAQLFDYHIHTKEEIRNEWIYPEAHVLLVDDMNINQIVFKELVVPWKLSVDTASSGEDGIEQAKNNHYDMIFMDQMMPGMNGTEAAEHILQFVDTPIILMTADSTDETRLQAKEKGLSAFLEKPVELEKLQKVLDHWMPEDLRERNLRMEEQVKGQIVYNRSAYEKILESVLQELKELEGELPHYFAVDLNLYRIKVHGIKGVTKQIGCNGMGRYAEIMEMAAKTENRSFIEQNMEEFLEELHNTIEQLEEELSVIPDQEEKVTVMEASGEKDAKEECCYTEEELWCALKEGFEAFDLRTIEESIKYLDEMELSDENHQILEQARKACDEFDYESGWQLLEQK